MNTTETKCPHCQEINEFADDDGYVEGPRAYHADCWDAIQARAIARLASLGLSEALLLDESGQTSAEEHCAWLGSATDSEIIDWATSMEPS